MSELNERVSRFVYVGIRRTSSGFGGATCGWMLLPRASSSWSSSFLPRICGGRGGRFFLVCMEGAGVYGGGPLLHDCVHDFRRLFLFFFFPFFSSFSPRRVPQQTGRQTTGGESMRAFYITSRRAIHFGSRSEDLDASSGRRWVSLRA